MSSAISAKLEDHANAMNIRGESFEQVAGASGLVMATPGFMVTIAATFISSCAIGWTSAAGGAESDLRAPDVAAGEGTSLESILEAHEQALTRP